MAQIGASTTSKCPTCGHIRGGPFTPAEFIALHPELQYPTKVIPEDTAAAQAEYEHLGREWNRIKDELYVAKEREEQAAKAASRAVLEDPAHARADEVKQLVAYLNIEWAEALERVEVARHAYYRLKDRDAARRRNADLEEQQRYFAEQAAAREQVEDEQKRTLRAKFAGRKH